MISTRALITVCFFAFVVTACDATKEDAADLDEDRANPPQQQLAEDKAAAFEEFKQPETLAERRELRERLAAHQAKQFEDRKSVPADRANAPAGEVPDEILEKIINELMTVVGAARADIEVLHAESLTFSDGSLDCGKPGQVYTQALVPGYRVILIHEGQQFDYRATEQGFLMLCEQPTLAAPGASSDPPAE